MTVSKNTSLRAPLHVKRSARVLVFVAAVSLVAGGTFVIIHAAAGTPQKLLTGGQPLGPAGSFPTMDNPLPPQARQVSLTAASSDLGASVTLPNTSSVTPSDVGAVWENTLRSAAEASSVAVAVTFPTKGFIVRYERPPVSDPLSNYQGFVKTSPGSEVVTLTGGVPALAIAQLPDGSNWGSVEFVTGGTTVVVMGHDDEATLQGVAESILNRAATASEKG